MEQWWPLRQEYSWGYQMTPTGKQRSKETRPPGTWQSSKWTSVDNFKEKMFNVRQPSQHPLTSTMQKTGFLKCGPCVLLCSLCVSLFSTINFSCAEDWSSCQNYTDKFKIFRKCVSSISNICASLIYRFSNDRKGALPLWVVADLFLPPINYFYYLILFTN